MRRLLLLAILVVCLFSGCTAKWPFAWKATENIKQAQALVEDDLGELVPHVAAAGQPHLKEAQGAARAVTTYVGTPEVRLKPIAVVNPATLTAAQADANRTPPTLSQVGVGLADEVEEQVLPWVDLLIPLLGVGAGAVVLKYRGLAKHYLDAFRDTVRGIQAGTAVMDDGDVETLKTELSKAQDKSTKAEVDKALKT